MLNNLKKIRFAALCMFVLAALPAYGFKQGDAWNEKNHQEITRRGLALSTFILQNFSLLNFSAEAVTVIENQNVNTDRGLVDRGVFDINEHFYDAEYHFDAELFSRSTVLIVDSRAAIIDHVKNERMDDARKLLGTTLHTIQDFYAHSNWVEKRLVDAKYPHPVWSSGDPFKAPEFNQPAAPGDLTKATCDQTSLLSDSPLTTGYYGINMSAPSSISVGFWTNGWRFPGHLDWPTGRCVHGGDGSTDGINKDHSDRGVNHFHAKDHAVYATQEFVQGILDDLSNSVLFSTDHICRFLGQEEVLCKSSTGKASLSKISALEPKYYASQYFTVQVEGSELSRFLTVDISGEGSCKKPIEGSTTAFKVSCFAYPAGTHIINVRDSLGVSLGSLTVEVGPENGRASSLITSVGQAISLWAENLYAAVTTAIWTIQGYANDVVAAVSNGVANSVTAVFSSTGLKDVFVRFADKDNNTVGSSRLAIEVTAAPVVPAAPIIVQALIRADGIAIVSGTAVPGVGVRITWPGNTTDSAVAAAGTGAFSFTRSALGLLAGNSVEVVAYNAAGVSTAVTRALQAAAPATIAVQDTFIWWGAYGGGRGEGRNFNDENRLVVCGSGWQASGNGTAKALLKFDHTQVPAGATNVYLHLYNNSSDTNYDATVEAYRADAAWSDADVTWNTQPAFSATVYGQVPMPASVPTGWVKIPLTSLVKEWQQNVAPNHGVVLDARTNAGSGCRAFAASNAAANQPYVSYDSGQAAASGSDTLEGAFANAPTPGAPWSFGWQSTNGAAPTAYGRFTAAGTRADYPTLAIWNKGAGNASASVYPWVVKNTGASAVHYGDGITDFPSQAVIVTPGSATERAVFRWTAPAAGAYEVSARFELMQGGSVDVRVQKNGTDLFVNQIAGKGSVATAPVQTVALNAGDSIDFAVGDGGNGQNSDITRVSASVQAATTSQRVKNPSNGRAYAVVTCGNWLQCRDFARAQGGTLATVRSQAEQDWIAANLLPKATSIWGFWIGFNDRAKDGFWVWESGEPAAYTNWSSWYNSSPNTEDAAHMVKQWGGTWNDTPADDPGKLIAQALIEYPLGAVGDTVYINVMDFNSNSLNIAADLSGNCRTGLVYNGPPYTERANLGEWDFSVPVAGVYTVFAQYSAAENRPVAALVDGAVFNASALAGTNGTWCSAPLMSESLGQVRLTAGAHVLTLQRTSVFPHLRSLWLTRVQ